MESVEINGVTYVPEGQSLPKIDEVHAPWRVGKIYHVRTVTFAIAGKLTWVGPNELLFSEASWIADTGRFSNYLKGNADSNLEVEPFKEEVIVNRGAVVDASIIDDFFKDQK